MGDLEIDLTFCACSIPLYTIMQKITISQTIGPAQIEARIGGLVLMVQALTTGE